MNERADAAFVIDSIVAEAKAKIKRANGYFTDLAWAEAPDWDWEAFSLSNIQRTPVIYVWGLGLGRGQNGNNIGQRRRKLILGVIGVVAANEKLKDAVFGLEDDFHQLMVRNQNRTYPDSVVQNTYGVTTFESTGETPIMVKYVKADGKGWFRAKYEVEIRAAITALS